jgi:hypothetical protein
MATAATCTSLLIAALLFTPLLAAPSGDCITCLPLPTFFARVLIKPSTLTLTLALAPTAASTSAAARNLALTFAPAFSTGMLITADRRLALSSTTLQSLALFSFSAGVQAAAASTLPSVLLASTTLAKLLCDIVWQLGRRIPRVLTFGFLGDVISQLLLLFFIFNPAPAVIDLVSTNRFRCFRHVLRIFLILNPGGD